MNREAITHLIEFLRTKPESSFDMGHWVRRESRAPCGTAACLAGWQVFLTDPKKVKELLAGAVYLHQDELRWVFNDAADALELPGAVARTLFIPADCDLNNCAEYDSWEYLNNYKSISNVTLEEAIGALENLLADKPLWKYSKHTPSQLEALG